jgi:integration host factor subunit beta
MIKSELIERLTHKTNQNYKDVESSVHLFLELITKELVEDGRVEIRGFGSFTCRKIPARNNARNPKTGQKLNIAASRRIHFKPGKELRDRVQLSQLKS